MTDPIAAAAQFLAGHVEWLRHQPFADEALSDVEACKRIVVGIADGHGPDKRYLGPCGALSEPESDEQGPAGTRECPGDIYARQGAQHGVCNVETCKATVAVADRQPWLDETVRSHAFRASEIAKAYDINVNTIRSWAARGQLVPHGHDADERPLYNVGDVLDLAAADAARRATEQAKRARRAAARDAADTGRMTA